MVAIVGSGQQGRATQSMNDLSPVIENTTQIKLIASLALFVVTLLCGYVPVRVLVKRAFIQHAMFVGAGVLLATAFCHLLPEAHDSFPKKGLPCTEITLCAGFLFMYALEQVVLAKLIYSRAHEHPLDLSARQPEQPAPNHHENAATSDPSWCPIQSSSSWSSSREPSPSPNVINFIRGFMIVSAFSVHSIFDGVAIGSQGSAPKIWTIFGAICCHKLIIAAVVGLELFAATHKSHMWTLIHLSLFSIMSPIGILLMVVTQNSTHSDHTIMILLQSFATGTLLYIIFIEILQPKEAEMHWQEGGKNRVGKCLSLIMGFLLMLAVLMLIDDGDDN